MADRIQIRRDTAANWASANPILAIGEMGFETDTNKLKIGTGNLTWSSLDYIIDSSIYALSSEVTSAVEAVIDAAPGTLNTLNELAAALGDDANFAGTMATSLAAKANTAALAPVATSGAYADVTGTPTLATVATTGAYTDVIGTPTLAPVATSGAYADVTGTPTLAPVATSGAYSDLTGTPTVPAALTDLSIADGTAGQVLSADGDGTYTFIDAASGGGGSFEAVASGTLANGDKVVVNTDGTVSVVSPTGGPVISTDPAGFGTQVVASSEANNQDKSFAVFDSNTNKVVVLYNASVEGVNGARVIVGTVSGKSISFGSPVAIVGAVMSYGGITFDSNANKVVVVMSNFSNSLRGEAYVGTVSGTSISFGSAVVFENSTNTSGPAATFDSNTNKVVVAYNASSGGFGGRAIVGTVSGNSISFGSSVALSESSPSFTRATFDSNSNKVVLVYKEESSTNGVAVVGTVSGDSISFGSPTSFVAQLQYSPGVAIDSSSKMVVAYRDPGNSNYGTAKVGTISGTSISFGSAVVFESVNAPYKTEAIFDSSANKFLIAYTAYTATPVGKIIAGTVSGTSISFDSPVVFDSPGGRGNTTTMTFDSASNKAVLVFGTSNNNHESVVYQAEDQDIRGPNLTSENFVGISNGAYANGATATIQTAGSVDDAQSGLTAGQAYFLQEDGTLNTTPDTPRVFAGVALSATELMIGRDLPADAGVTYTDSDVATYLSGNGYDTATNIVASITDSAPATLDTLNELAAALGDDANFASTVTSSLALKADTSSLSTVATTGAYSDLTGTPTGLATETYVDTAVSNLVDTAPDALNTLNELAAALGDDANFASTVTSSLALKADTSSLSTVATSGSYNDLTDQPVIAAGGGSFEAVASGTLANGDTVIINADGTVASVVSRAGGSLLHTLDNPNAYGTSADDQFGVRVSMSGNYAIVGANTEDDAGGTSSGKAYIFDNNTGALLHTLNNPNAYGTSSGDEYGYGIAISDTYAIVGAPYEADAGGTYSGKVYIYSVTSGALLRTLDNPNAYGTSSGDIFGDYIAIDGNTLVVNAIVEDDAGGANSGKAYIFNVSTGALLHTLDNPNAYGTSAGDQFSSSVAISGNTVIIGARYEDDAGGTSSGKAYIFNASTGALLHTLDNPSASGASSWFGNSVAVSGNYAIVGAQYEASAGTQSGKAYIYNVTSGALVHTLDNPNAYDTSVNDRFGNSVSISNTYAIVSAPGEDDAGGTESGKAYIFNVTSGELVLTIDNPNAYGTSAGDNFGQAVAISGNHILVSAWYEDDASGTQSGKAYIFSNPDVNTTNLTSENFVGISDGSYASGATATIQTAGVVDDAQSGLTAGQAYYVQGDGTLNTTPDSTRVFAGVAVSATKLLIGRDLPADAAAAYTDSDVATYLSGNGYDTATNIVASITDSAPATLDTLNELAAALGDDANFASTVTSSLALKADTSSLSTVATTGAYSDLTGTPTGLATETYVDTAVSNLVDTAPEALNTLNELAAALGDDANFAGTVTTSLAAKANTADLATVATSGSYNDLTDQPVIAAGGGSFEAVASGTLANGDTVIINADGTISLPSLIYPSTSLLQTLDNPNAYGTSAGDQFGQVVAISGNYAIVSAHNEDDAGGASSGKAYIFNVTTGALLHTLDNPNPYGTSLYDGFGSDVAISDTYAIVGASGEDDASGVGSGKAYIYNVSTGALLHTLDNPNAYGTSAGDTFGQVVAISGNYAIVGAYSEDDAGGTSSGKAYIYNVSTGALLHTLDNPNAYGTSESDSFGWSVAITDTYAIVGAISEKDASGNPIGYSSGKAYIFNVSTGALLHTLDNPNPYDLGNGDQFGYSVAITDTYAIVAASGEDDSGGTGSGKAYIFNVSTGALLHTLDNPNAYGTSANDVFGVRVSISGNYAIVGAFNEDDAGGTDSGKAYIFNVTTGALVHTLDNLNAYGTSADDFFGLGVSISGNYAIVGARSEDDAGGASSGKAYIYEMNNTTGTTLTTENFVGISNAAYSDGATATIQTAGVVDDAQSGLTAGQAYFVQADGTLGLTPGTPRVFAGVAVSATKLLIGRDLPADAGVTYTDSDVATYLSGNGYDTATNIVASITDSAPATLDTLNELAAALGDDANFASTVTSSLALKADTSSLSTVATTGAYSDLTGTPTGLATETYVDTAVSNLVDTAPEALNTLNELAAALGDDANFASTVTSSLALKADTLSLSTVATSGSYNDLTDQPVIAAGGGSFEATASGTLANGDPVIINADGTISLPSLIYPSAFLHTLDNPNPYGTSQNDYFGTVGGISGNYAIVTAYKEDDAGGNDSGKAYIYNNSTGALVHTLTNPNAYGTSAGDSFGSAAAISGNYAIVSANGEDDAGGTWSGKAYIYNVSTGALLHTLDNPNAYGTSAGDTFGDRVAISDTYSIVSAYAEDDAGGTTSGKAYIYNNSTGALLHTLDNPNAYDTSAGDSFGRSVGITDNYAIVGAYNEGDAGGTNSGKAYIFNVSTGALVHTLDNPNAHGTSQYDYFGWSVAISGNYAIVGAYGESDADGTYDSGKAYIYNVTTGALLHTLDNPNEFGTSTTDNFAYSVGISDTYAIVGTPDEDDANGTSTGKVYIFSVSTGALLETQNNPNAYGTPASDGFGRFVAITDDYALAGTYIEDDAGGGNSGKAYIYEINNTTGTTLTTENYAGISDGAYASGATATIQTAGVVDDAQSGLTAGQAYYVQGDGTLNTTPDTPRVFAGVAVSATKLLIGRDLPADAAAAYTDSDVATYLSGNGYDTATNIVASITDSAPATLDTLNELAAALGDDANFAGTVTTSLAAKANTADLATVATSGSYNDLTDQPVIAAGGGSFEAVASGTLANGDTVIINADGTVAAVAQEVTTSLLQTLSNPSAYGTSAYDVFGGSVSVSGDYAIVGAPFEDDAGGTTSGKAYIFNATTGALLQTLDNPNAYGTSASDQFGYSVGISGNYAIVGAWPEDDAGGTSSGKAYIFDNNTGALLHTLNNPNVYGTSASDQFGRSVAISGDYAIVAAYNEDEAGGTQSGKAYIFNVTTGALVHTLDNPSAYGTSESDEFGISVAISDNYAIVGAIKEDDAGGAGSGKAYIYNVSTGALLHTLDNPNAYDTSEGDAFGVSVGITDTYAIVGAYAEDDAGGTSSGKAYIFNVTTGALVYTLDNPNAYDTSASDQFGNSVSISDNYAIVGAYNEDDATGLTSGKAYIFDVTTGALVYTLDNPNPYGTSADDQFGKSVSISDNYVIVSAQGEGVAGGDGSGKAYIYSVPATSTNLTAENYAGIADASYADAATATIQTAGSVDDAQSGLTAGQAYYVQGNGTLGLTPGTPRVFAGVAVSATKLLIGRDLPAEADGTFISLTSLKAVVAASADFDDFKTRIAAL